jgi:hypothetical protein
MIWCVFKIIDFSGSGLSHLLSDNVVRGENFASVTKGYILKTVNFVIAVLKVIQTDICILSNL